MKTQTVYFTIIFMATLALFSCSDSDDNNTTNAWSCGDSIVDVDGNTYSTVNIDGQCWTVQNLDVSKYNDGSMIPNITDQTEWVNTTEGAWSYYNNDITLGVAHGKLYNWFAIETEQLCPEGWHVASSNEWNTLVNNLGGASIAGEAMKFTTGWNNSPDNASNSSGLSVVPSGNRDIFGGFLGMGENVWFFTSTEDSNDDTRANYLKVSSGTETSTGTASKNDGLPCRCVLD
ncbi:fibrobacter succinogenes major paralogous domain-containing protein [uncultured Psychroserpens sp.]|uniref:fibrobacter succinogenes major paralogous domain-containing protein n=1 Tax=uncultured Psychroserpens sp. TaxID=255436 RepID=UPI002611B0D6|nr:fibrobacter succinogenes major paralogous domain-containing protein [uncultured Psychroserpens sp.]